MIRFTFDADVEHDGKEITVIVVYSVTPFIPATYWQPDEGGEVELISVRHKGQSITLPDEIEQELLEQAKARAHDDMNDEAAARADWELQDRRDRQLMEKWEDRP